MGTLQLSAETVILLLIMAGMDLFYNVSCIKMQILPITNKNLIQNKYKAVSNHKKRSKLSLNENIRQKNHPVTKFFYSVRAYCGNTLVMVYVYSDYHSHSGNGSTYQ
jgi:hypothetical protein